MGMILTRRGMMGAAALGTSLALSRQMAAAATAAPAPPIFGPAPGVALLSRNENPYGPSPKAIAAIADVAGKSCYYADNGHRCLTDMIAERFALDPKQVLLGEGSTEVLCAAALAYTGKGAILAPDLFWDTTVQYAEKKGAVVKRVPLGADMGIDLDAMAAAVTPDVGLVHICNPNNPTGMLIDADKLRAFCIAVGPKATVLVDEAYNELTTDPAKSSMADLVAEGHNVIVLRTFSKIYGLAGLRVGYALGAPDKVELIRSYLMSFGGNAAGLAAAIASYDDHAFTAFSKNRVVEARGILAEAVKAAGLTALPSETNFMFVKVPDAEKVRAAMAEKQILIRGPYGKWTGWSRVSTGKIEDVKRYAAALPEIFNV